MMKNIKFIFMIASVAIAVTSCFKEAETVGFIGDNIYLQGGDTLYVAVGAAVSTSTAWLDNSTKPVTFKIENVRDVDGNRHEGFFQTFPTRLWNTPYDYTKDTTLNQVLEKLTYFDMTPLMINEVNGQLRAMESTAKIDVKPGEIYYVDVSATNSKGTRYLENYAVIKFESGVTASDFVCNELINGIGIVLANDEVCFPYYEQVNDVKSNWSELQEKIYAGETVQGMSVRKISDEPAVGVKLLLKFTDSEGKIFDPAGYASYGTSESFLTHGVNRQDTEDGMSVEFPYTPWPVSTSTPHLGYMRGKMINGLDGLDMDSLKNNFRKLYASKSIAGWPDLTKYPELLNVFYDFTLDADNDGIYDSSKGDKVTEKWPVNDFSDAKGWYVRLRSRLTFYQPGTYELAVQVPYTKLQ